MRTLRLKKNGVNHLADGRRTLCDLPLEGEMSAGTRRLCVACKEQDLREQAESLGGRSLRGGMTTRTRPIPAAHSEKIRKYRKRAARRAEDRRWRHLGR